jgi:hypothetical protein
MTEQLEMELDQQEPSGYFIELRRGPQWGGRTIKSAVVRTLPEVVSIVEGYRNYAVQAGNVTWKDDRVTVGFVAGLAPGGETWEICIDPAVTVDA